MHVVRHLGRGPQRELAFAVERGERRVLLDRQMGVAFVEEQVLEDMVRSRERFFDIAKFESLQAMDIAALAIRMDPRLGLSERFFRIANGVKNPVSNLDEIQRLGRRLLVLRHHRRDRIADVAHVLGCQRILVLSHGKDAEGHREIFAGQYEMYSRQRNCV